VVGEEPLIAVIKEVGQIAPGPLCTGALAAAVARDVAAAAAEVIDGEQAVVGAAPAPGVLGLEGELCECLAIEQG